MTGRMIDAAGTRFFVEERGDGLPLLLLHGGPGLDHHAFADYLDPLGDGYHLLLVDQRSQGLSDPAPRATWTLEQMAADVTAIAAAADLARYAVLGHSYGAFVALQHAVDFPGAAAATIVSAGLPSARYLAGISEELERFEPSSLRARVAASWAREAEAQTPGEVAGLLRDQMPFHFADPLDARIDEYNRRTGGMIGSPDVLRHFATQSYGGIEVAARLGDVSQPVLVLAGRHDRTCPVQGAEEIARGIPGAQLVVFERSAHTMYVEEQDRYLTVVRDFLDRVVRTR